MKVLFRTIPRCAIGVLTIAGCLLAARLNAEEGDLDPGFGDVGRVGPISAVLGAGWSIYALEDGSLVSGGGEVTRSCPADIIGCDPPRYVGFTATSFLIRISSAGHLLESHEIPARNFHLLAIARQIDGKFLAAGRVLNERSFNSEFVVYRLNQDGSLDNGFGDNGLVQLPAEERSEVDAATAVLVEPDGRIVVAGSTVRSGNRSEILIRLLTNGDIDQTFGSSGVVVVPGRFSTQAVQVPTNLTRLVRTDEGDYRVSNSGFCQVVGLTADGSSDLAFGTSGAAHIDHPISGGCRLTMAMQSDGRLVVGASDGEAAVVTRILVNGQPDPNFLAGTGPSDRVGFIIHALAVGPDGSIVVALGLSDFGYHGLTVKQLLPSGQLNESFGDAGSTEIEMPSELGSVSLLFDMLVREDGAIVGVGGNPFASPSQGPILVRLLGAGGGDGPGVLSFSGPSPTPDEQDTDVLVEVKRTAGSAGPASVAYQVLASDDANSAIAGEDFVADADRLDWEDGDATSRNIRVRIVNDDLPEYAERLRVLLTDAEGGVGLGRAGQYVVILANDGATSDHPQVGFANDTEAIGEASGSVTISVSRSSPADHALTVRYATASGSASNGSDYSGVNGSLEWGVNNTAVKTIVVDIANDTQNESDETFTVTLSDPSSGVSLGPIAIVTVHIADDDLVGGGGGDGGGGGGAAGLISVLLLGLARLLQAMTRRPRTSGMGKQLGVDLEATI